MKYTEVFVETHLIPHPVLILALVANAIAGLFEMLRRQVVMRAAVRQSAAE